MTHPGEHRFIRHVLIGKVGREGVVPALSNDVIRLSVDATVEAPIGQPVVGGVGLHVVARHESREPVFVGTDHNELVSLFGKGPKLFLMEGSGTHPDAHVVLGDRDLDQRVGRYPGEIVLQGFLHRPTCWGLKGNDQCMAPPSSLKGVVKTQEGVGCPQTVTTHPER